MFNINYHTGVGNQYGIATLEEAMTIADEGACYTQENITIERDGKVVATRAWVSLDPNEDEDIQSIISFGSYGHYSEWLFD